MEKVLNQQSQESSGGTSSTASVENRFETGTAKQVAEAERSEQRLVESVAPKSATILN